MSSASTPNAILIGKHSANAAVGVAAAAAQKSSATASVDYALVERTLAFHGQPMQKVWEGEHGDKDLARAAIHPDFSVYAARQKGFVFSDRAKRLQLHQFLARKADVLYARQRSNTTGRTPPLDRSRSVPAEGVAPLTAGLPFNCFFGDQHDKSAQLQQIFKLLKIGDVVYAEITNRTVAGLFAHVLCTRPPNFHYLANLNAKAMLSTADLVPAIDRRGAIRAYSTGDHVLAEILEMTPDSERMVIGMRGVMQPSDGGGGAPIVFGLIDAEQMPAQFKEVTDGVAALSGSKLQRTYTERLDASAEFQNPNGLAELARIVGLDLNARYTNMADMRGNYPTQEYSAELRQQQASKWAFRSVAEGIEHFKEGRHSEAFQCLNKALSIDPRNVEGLVARGALYANSGSFKKAVDDFETALKLNANHANARKYMGETLVALGRSYEEEHNIEEAKGAYQACLDIIPAHEEARNSLDFLWSKVQTAGANELTLPALNLKIAEQKRGGPELRTEKRDSGGRRSSGNNKKGKKKKSKSRKRDSSSSSSDSSDSSDSSSQSYSSDSSSSTDSEYSKSKRKRRTSRYPPKQRSLSPLSKRMAASMANESNASGARAVQPATYSYDQSSYAYNQPDDYEMKVRKFLEMTRDEVNYDQKVKQFVEDTNKYRKDRKPGGGSDDKSSSRKKEKHKKRKSSQRDSKKSKRSKEKRSKTSKRDKRDSSKGGLGDLENIELREALKIIKSLPGLDIPAKLLGMEKSVAALHQKETIKKEEDTKWKMLFAKDKASGSQHQSKLQPKQYAFSIDDDEDNDSNDIMLAPALAQPANAKATAKAASNARSVSPLPLAYQRSTSNAAHAASTTTTSVSSTKPPSQHVHAVHVANAAASAAAAAAAVTASTSMAAAKPKAPAVVLDKFGSFRLASVDDEAGGSGRKPTSAGGSNAPVALASTQRRSHDDDDDDRDDDNKDDNGRRSRSRSHSRRRRERRRARARSDSDDSRSPRRRSGSRQYRRSGGGGGGLGGSGRAGTTKSRSRSRSVDRSRSRSGTYSRSRSRSGSADRHGRQQYGGRGGGRGGYYRGNGTYYKPHFNNQNQHSSNYRGNNQHYNNNRGGQIGYRGGYNNYQNYNNNRGGGGYVNNRGGGYQQHHQNNYHFNNNGGNGGMNHHQRGRGGWVNRGQHQQGGNYRSYSNNGGVTGGRGRGSRSRSPDDDDDDEGEHSKVSRRRRAGRSSSRERDDDDVDVRSVSSAGRSNSKAMAESTTAAASTKK